MGNVNKHAHPIHLPNEPPSLVTYTTPLRFRLAERVLEEGGVGELVVAVVGERGVPHAKGVVQPQVRDGVANLVEALDAQRRDELAALEGGFRVPAIYGAGEVVWIDSLEAVDQVDLLQRKGDTYESQLAMTRLLRSSGGDSLAA